MRLTDVVVATKAEGLVSVVEVPDLVEIDVWEEDRLLSSLLSLLPSSRLSFLGRPAASRACNDFGKDIY